jgi:hypothetical protein
MPDKENWEKIEAGVTGRREDEYEDDFRGRQ